MNRYTKRLFRSKDPYDVEGTNQTFLHAMQAVCSDLTTVSEKYRAICEYERFKPDQLLTVDDLHRIPLLPTLYLKRNDLSFEHKSVIEVTSSGTSGTFSRIGYSFTELYQLLKMAIRMGRHHRLFSFRRTHAIVLGYQPNKNNQTVISKTAFLSTLFTVPASRQYALTYKNGSYELDLDHLIDRLVCLSKRKTPIRIIGFPSYAYFLLEKIKERGISLRLPSGSKILFGGGWKQFSENEISKEEMSEMLEETLGVTAESVHEFFGAAEHPVLYVACKNRHFHIPVYARVLIRDPKTLVPAPYGTVGLVNLMTPIHSSVPLINVMTDDLGVLWRGSRCGCGNAGDYLEILGRVGVRDIHTCAAGAGDLLKEEQ